MCNGRRLVSGAVLSWRDVEACRDPNNVSAHLWHCVFPFPFCTLAAFCLRTFLPQLRVSVAVLCYTDHYFAGLNNATLLNAFSVKKPLHNTGFHFTSAALFSPANLPSVNRPPLLNKQMCNVSGLKFHRNRCKSQISFYNRSNKKRRAFSS